MAVCQRAHNAYYPTPAKGLSVICGSRKIRYCRRFILVRQNDLSPVSDARRKISNSSFYGNGR
jgi:hypothetical protein